MRATIIFESQFLKRITCVSLTSHRYLYEKVLSELTKRCRKNNFRSSRDESLKRKGSLLRLVSLDSANRHDCYAEVPELTRSDHCVTITTCIRFLNALLLKPAMQIARYTK